MVSLQPIQTVTVSGPLALASATYPARAEILDPTKPVFVSFQDIVGDPIVFVNGTQVSTYNGTCNVVMGPMVSLYSSTYNSAITGGGVSNVQNCNVSASYGYVPWFQIANLETGSVSSPSQLIPSTSYTGIVFGLMYDFIHGYMIISFGYECTSLILYFIPFSELSTLFAGSFPSTYYTVMVNAPGTNFCTYITPTYLWNGNLIQPMFDLNNNEYIWMIPISTLLQNIQPGNPTGSSITAGNIYSIYAPGDIINETMPISVMLYPTSSGPKSVVAIPGRSSSTVTVSIWDPSIPTVIKRIQVNEGASLRGSAFYKNTFLIRSGSNKLTLLDLISGNVESTSSSVDASLVATSRGYVLGTRNSLSDSSITFDIYKVSYQDDFEFTNVSVSGSTITGTLYNATTGQGAQYQAVYLVQLRSMYSNYIGDSVPVASTITGSNGQFTINYPMSPGAYYGLVYMSS